MQHWRRFSRVVSGRPRVAPALPNLRLLDRQLAPADAVRTRCAATDEWQRARPFGELPAVTMWEFLTGFMPGGRFYNKPMDEFLSIVFREKGDIVCLPGFMGSPTRVITQNPDDFETVFRNEGPWPIRKGLELLNYHRKRHRKEHFGEMSGLLTTQGKEWADFRTAVNPIVVHPKNAKVYIPTMDKVNETFIKRIKTIRDPRTLEVPADFTTEICRWTLESVCLVALDKQLHLIGGDNPEAERFLHNVQTFFDITNDLELRPSLWRLLPTPKFKRIMATLDDMMHTTEKYINEAVARAESTAPGSAADADSVLAKLLRIDKHIAVVMAMEMLFAGVDTTMSAFSGLLLCLATNPAKQQRLRAEILRILPQKNSPLSAENMKNLPYLRACIKESQRYYPLSLGNLRTAQHDLVLSGYRVPRGTEVSIININPLRDPAHYSQPDAFIPERWLRDAEAATASRSAHPFVYLPFGFGPRSCIGRRIAEMELEIGVARIVRNFNVEFNHSTANAFKSLLINVPNIPLQFKFTDLPN